MAWWEEARPRPMDRKERIAFHPGWSPTRWTGRRFHLVYNKEVFGAGIYASYQPPPALRSQWRERHHLHRLLRLSSGNQQSPGGPSGPRQTFPELSSRQPRGW